MANHGRVAFETLGCKLNFSESSALLRGLTEAGYAKVAVEDRPDVVVVNTCSVTDHADAKCRNIVRRAKAAGSPLIERWNSSSRGHSIYYIADPENNIFGFAPRYHNPGIKVP